MELIDAWVEHLRATGFPDRTACSHRQDVKRIQRRLYGVRIEDAAITQLNSALAELKLLGLYGPELKGLRSSLQLFLSFLAAHIGRPAIQLGHITGERPIARRLPFPSVDNPIPMLAQPTFTPRSYNAVKFPALRDREYLITRYVDLRMGTLEIATELGCTKQTVHKALRAHGIESRTHSQAWKASAEKEHTKIRTSPFDEDFFRGWSPAVAYVFGVILTDGYLYQPKARDGSRRVHSGRVSISQKEPELLERVSRLMRYVGRLQFQPRRVYNGVVAGAVFTLAFSSDKAVADLVRLGLRPRKSLTLKFPDLPQDLQRHFIRGCWDGDGSAFMERNIKLIASFVSGSRDFMTGMCDVLRLHGIPCSRVYVGRGGKNPSYSLKVRGAACVRLYDFLYHGVAETMYLTRKREVFKRAIGREPIVPASTENGTA